jgi:NhaA family Na+:H+ antiporter
VIAALGGMVVPAVLYLAFNYQDPVTREGWAIPAATDIAFALGILALLGNRVPVALKVFLMALAIIDDLGAIVIIALFYTSDLSLLSLAVAAGAIAVMVLLNACNVRRTGLYILVGLVLWTAVLKSGVHATLAGVIIGFLIPLKEKDGRSPARELEHVLHPWVAFLILPLFAFANAGVSLSGVTVEGLTSLLPMGIIAGLFIGKPLGISLFCWAAVKLKLASLPEGTTGRDIMAVGVLCGIGFTMSIFIASLAFSSVDPALITWAKLGILLGSLLSAVVGYSMLRSRFSSAQIQH